MTEDKQTDNQPALQPPDRLIEIQSRYSGGASERGNYEVRANDLAWLIQEVELSRARVAGVVATVDLTKRIAEEILNTISVNDFRQMQRFNSTKRLEQIVSSYATTAPLAASVEEES